MKKYNYDSYSTYRDLQIKVSKEKKGRKNIEKHLAVISNIKNRIDLMIKDRKKINILCIGSRNCNEVRAFNKLFHNNKYRFEITTIDLSGIKNKFIIKFFMHFKKCVIKYMDMNSLQFADNTFDIVYAHHSLEHNPKPELAASEFIRVTKKNGIIYVVVPLIQNPDAVECVKYEDENDLIGLFNKHIGKIFYSKVLNSGEDKAEEKELRFAFEIEK